LRIARIAMLTLAAGVAACITADFAHAAPAPERIAADVDRYMTVRTEMGRFSGAVLIAKDDTVILRKGYGYADVEKRTPYTPETRHEAASISKMFTAMAALRLRDQGKLELDDSICLFLDRCPDAWKPITIRELMRHTSGIPDYESAVELGSPKYLELMAKPGASARILDNARTLPLDFAPGSKFSYSNTGYIALSFVIERAAGAPFADVVTKMILKPAGMTHSSVLGTAAARRGLAHGYTFEDVGWVKTLAGYPLTSGHLKRVPELPLTSPEGDAWLCTTVDDLYRWSRVMDGKGFIPAAEAAEALEPGLESYAYGWFVAQAFDRRRARHNGSLPGYVSDFVKFPEDGLTIILVSNLDRAPLSRIMRDVTSIALGTPYDMPVRGEVVTLTDEQLAPLLSDYKNADGTVLTIRKEPDYLTAEIKGRYVAGLIPLSPIEFYFPMGDGRAIFTLGPDGKAASVNMRFSGEDHVATRVVASP
jgi:CubicO group peptidase (beta-lactamase class C family)